MILKKHTLNKFITAGALGLNSGIVYGTIMQAFASYIVDSMVPIVLIGLMSFRLLPFSIKPLWSLSVDAMRLKPFGLNIGHRKSWILCCQLLIVLCMICMGIMHNNLYATFSFCLLMCVCGSIADTAMEAYRIELFSSYNENDRNKHNDEIIDDGANDLFSKHNDCASNNQNVQDTEKNKIVCDKKLNFASSIVITTYRVGFIFSGPLAISASSFMSWSLIFCLLGCMMLPGIMIIIFSQEEYRFSDLPILETNTLDINVNKINPQKSSESTKYTSTHKFRQFITTLIHIESSTIRSKIVLPLLSLIKLKNFVFIAIVLAFYKISDSYLDIMLIPFLTDMGFSKIDIGMVAKNVGIVATIIGTFTGSYISKFGVLKWLFISEIFAALTNFLFIAFVKYGNNIILLGVISFTESFWYGVCNVMLINYMSSICNLRFTATHYAILYSISSIIRTFLASTSGIVVYELGWVRFFLVSATFSIPSLLAILALHIRQSNKINTSHTTVKINTSQTTVKKINVMMQ